MTDTSAWISADRARRPVQTHLVPETFNAINSICLKNVMPIKSSMRPSENMPLSAFGFTKTRLSRPAKRKAITHGANEIADSQFDTNYCPITPRKKVKHEYVSSPARSLQYENVNALSSDDAPTSPLAVEAHHMTTPRVSRFIEHNASDPVSSPEVPSSLAYERYHYEAWSKETPVRPRVQLHTQFGLIASPPKSSPYRARGLDEHLSHISPASKRWLRTPPGFPEQVDTPPPSHPGHDHLNRRFAANKDVSDFPGKRAMRIPLRELDPSCVLKSNSRKVFAGREDTASISSPSRSFSIRGDSPTEWFDALETLTPPLARERSALIHTDEEIEDETRDAQVSAASLRRANTVQDSQFDEALEPMSIISEDASHTAPDLNTRTPVMDQQTEDNSWRVHDSLLNTLLPPGYKLSQLGNCSETQDHGYSSELCPLPPSSSPGVVGGGGSPMSKRKYSLDYAAASSSNKKTKHDMSFSDEAVPQSSWEQDNSLMYTILQPPPFPAFSLPSTADHESH